MPSFEPLKSELVDLYKKLEIKRVVYFHCDHWEPWRQTKPGATVYSAENQDAVARFTDQISRIDFARRLTLFYKPTFNFLVGAEIFANDTRTYWAAAPDDLVHVLERTPPERKLARDVIDYLTANTGCELQFHLHHENFTYNTDLQSKPRKDYLPGKTARSFEEERLDLGIKMSLAQIAEDTGKPLDRWFFVHGHWGLNASDPGVCHLTREIEILHANGGRGDFTVPAGRPVNPRLEVPYFVTPLDAPKGYDLQEAGPEFAYGNKTAPDRGKFLIWSSVIKHKGSSLDYYAPWVRQRLEDVAVPARDLIKESFRADGTVFMKTHAHSLHPDYSNATRFPICPHAFPFIQTLFCLLFDAAAAAGCQVDFLTASEVYNEFVTAEHQPAGGFGLTIPGEPPVVSGIVPAPRNWRPDVRGYRAEGTGPQLSTSAANAQAAPQEPAAAEPAKSAEPTPYQGQLQHAEAINAAAIGVVRRRIEELGEQASGAGSYYAARLASGHILTTYEKELAEVLLRQSGKFDQAFDIGCGFGVLTILLAANGLAAEGLETDSKRVAVAEAVLNACREGPAFAPLPCAFRFGRFPKALAGRDVSKSVALFTNMTTTISPEERMELFGALGGFKTVVLDVQRFLERRTTRDEFDALIGELEAAGLTQPRVFADCEDRGRYVAFDGAAAVKQRRKTTRAA